MVQRYEQKRRLQWYKRGAAYEPLTYFYDTLMILLGSKTEKYHFVIFLSIKPLSQYFQQKMRL